MNYETTDNRAYRGSYLWHFAQIYFWETSDARNVICKTLEITNPKANAKSTANVDAPDFKSTTKLFKCGVPNLNDKNDTRYG